MTKCPTCGSSVNWKRASGTGAWQCFNADGSSHWDKCSERRWKQVVKTGTPFTEKSGSKGFSNSVHGTKYALKMDGKFIKGKNYKPLCDCELPPINIPPWEHCEHTRAL